MPPFGPATQLRVFVDPDLLQYDEVWAAAGTWNDNFGAAPADIVRVAGLDAIDGTPVVDIKPWMVEFGPRGDVSQPSWSSELMKDYW